MSKSPISNTSKRAIVPETPRSQKSFAHDINITALRDEIAKEMDGEFIRCPVDAFIEAYLPFAPSDEDMNYFVKKLLGKPVDLAPSGTGPTTRSMTKPKASILVGDELNLLFRKYLDKDIKRSTHGPEVVAFGSWSEFAAEIAKIPYPQNRRKRNRFTYVNMPNKKIESNIPGSDNRIDAGFVAPRDESRKIHTHDIAVVLEHKLDVQKKRDNALQAVSANVQIMNDDARRMFTFGITAESNEMTLWYHSRSHSAASERFRFTQDPKTFIQVLIAFLFATEEELGYDPMVALEADGKYTFKVPDPNHQDKFHRFRTIETLSFYRSNNITGRMARVYKASRINEIGEAFGEPVVLKDVWLDETAQTEREIQNAIFADIEKFWTNDDAPAKLKVFKDAHSQIVTDGSYKQYFLDIVQDHQGRTTHPLAEGGKHEKGILAKPDLAPPNTKTGNKTATSSPDDSAAVDTHPIPSNLPEVPMIPRTYVRKRQYRVVFKEICKTVGKLETLGEVVNVLRQTLTPLQLLFCAGWVHRDISSGNILAYKKDFSSPGLWAAKLSDLEYAKRFPLPEDSERASDPKTGTPYFMPLEVMMSKYLLSEMQDEAKPIDEAAENMEEIFEDELAAYKLDLAAGPHGSLEETVVVHNFQHDLESLWWILLWTISCRLDPAHSTQRLLNFGKAVFINKIRPSSARMNCFSTKTFGVKKIAPESLVFPVIALQILRKQLHDNYIQLGRDASHRDVGSYSAVHSSFSKAFNALEKRTKGEDWPLLPLLTTQLSHTGGNIAVSAAKEPERKRARSDEDDIDPRTAGGEGRTKAKQPKNA